MLPLLPISLFYPIAGLVLSVLRLFRTLKKQRLLRVSAGLLAALLMFTKPSPGQSGGSHWDSTRNDLFGEGIVFRGATEQTFPLLKFGKAANLSLRFGEEHALGPHADQPWTRQLALLAGPRISRTFASQNINGVVQLGAEWTGGIRPNGVRDSVMRPYATYWVGWNSQRKFPGSSWGTIRLKELYAEGTVFRGAFEQGRDLKRTRSFIFNTYLGSEYAYGTKENKPWNRQISAIGGLKAKRPFEAGIVQIGAEYVHGWRQGQADQGVRGYVNWWFHW